MNKYSFHRYQLFNTAGTCKDGSTWQGWIYEIYTDDQDYQFFENTDVIAESDEWYNTGFEADLAARSYIDKLESGD